ncbi:DUF1801 domain-containing protein [Gulosibacter sediminis]|uniref:DUF1801 domain-containing protein n=1 Tax=Gulosibacter sediminis TaxID=1729695 RepID=UPI0024A9C93A|nr:DUF1801 domain-containing protein [Gulosibacter sediminis]
MSEKIDGFLRGLEEQADGRYEIIVKLRDLVRTSYPDAEEVFQYGGLLYKDRAFLFSGLFPRRNYITVEVGGGAYIDDLYGLLEGKGGKEGRKHLRIFDLSDVEEKHVEEYLALAWETH